MATDRDDVATAHRPRKQPKRLTNDVVAPKRSAAVGWSAAEAILKRVRDEKRRELLLDLAAKSGAQGAPAFEYLAKCLRYHVDGGDYPLARKLPTPSIDFINRRTVELLEPFMGMWDGRLPPVDQWKGVRW